VGEGGFGGGVMLVELTKDIIEHAFDAMGQYEDTRQPFGR
jgi:hypothetical protein